MVVEQKQSSPPSTLTSSESILWVLNFTRCLYSEWDKWLRGKEKRKDKASTSRLAFDQDDATAPFFPRGGWGAREGACACESQLEIVFVLFSDTFVESCRRKLRYCLDIGITSASMTKGKDSIEEAFFWEGEEKGELKISPVGKGWQRERKREKEREGKNWVSSSCLLPKQNSESELPSLLL